MFPGMGRGITGDHPSRAPDFWPFASVEGHLVAKPPRSQRPEAETVPQRRYEWPAVDLGSLPSGSYFRRVPPPKWDPKHGGRRVRPELTGATWEEWGRSLHTAIQADGQRRPERNTLPAGVEPAATTLNDVLREVIGSALRNLGMTGSGGRFRLERQGHQAGVAFQRSVHNHKEIAEFTINLQGTATRWFRIGQVLPEMEDTWWVLPAGASTDRLEADLLKSLRDYALVAIEAALEEPPPLAPWTDSRRPPAPSEVRQIWQIYPVPPTLDQLYQDAFNSFISEKLRSGHGPKQVREMVTVMSLIMKCAVKANARKDNPAAGHELHVPRRRVLQVPMLTMDQAALLVEHTTAHYRPAMWLLIFTGMRPSELCGLRVEDADLVRRVVHIRQTWSPVPAFDGGSREYVSGPAKSEAGQRTIPIPEWLCHDLAADLRAA